MGRLDQLGLTLSLSKAEEAERLEAGQRRLAAPRLHELGRWQLVEGESKRHARVKVLETTIAEIGAAKRARGMEPPETTETRQKVAG